MRAQPGYFSMKVPLLLKEIEAKTEDPGERGIINKILQGKESSLRDLDDKMKWLRRWQRAVVEAGSEVRSGRVGTGGGYRV